MASGVYEIRSSVSGKRYIGSSVNIDARIYEHKRLLKKSQHHSIALQRAWEKYGPGAFIASILCECEPKYLFHMEQH